MSKLNVMQVERKELVDGDGARHDQQLAHDRLRAPPGRRTRSSPATDQCTFFLHSKKAWILPYI